MIALQHVEPARDRIDAQQMLDGCAIQIGYLGGRVVEDHRGWWELRDRPTRYRMQAFFADAPGVDWFPDGTRRVLIPDAQLKAVGIRYG